MSKITITSDKLADAIERELTIYHEDILEKLRVVTRKSMTKLVRKTAETAPLGKRLGGNFAASISGDFRGLKRGNRHVSAMWYVKAPNHRLTHLIVKGHATKDGNRTDANPFLSNALDEVLPEYENEIKEVLTNGK